MKKHIDRVPYVLLFLFTIAIVPKAACNINPTPPTPPANGSASGDVVVTRPVPSAAEVATELINDPNFLNAVRGPSGPPGADGAEGRQGPPGLDGAQGPQAHLQQLLDRGTRVVAQKRGFSGKISLGV